PKRAFITCIEEINNGDIWFANRGGISIYQDEQIRQIPLPSEIQNSNTKEVSNLIEIQDGLVLFNVQGDTWRTSTKNPGQASFLLKRTVGIGKKHGGRFVFLRSEPHVDDVGYDLLLFVTDQNTLSQDSIVYYSSKGLLALNKKLAFKYIEVGCDEQWYSHGRDLYHQQGSNIQKFDLRSGMPSSFVNDIVLGPDSTIWVATDKGVCFGNEESGFQYLTILGEALCREIVFDDRGHIWIGTQQGLFHWDWESEYLAHYTQTNGLVSSNINSLLIDKRHRLWIGTNKGISLIDLEKTNRKFRPPSLVLESISLDGEAFTLDTIPQLKSEQNLSWTYQGLYYSNPDEVRYRYRFAKQEPWQETTDNVITVSSLQAGNYELELETRNAQSQWSKPLRFPFQVLAPWWQNHWIMFFSLILVLCVLGLLFYISMQFIKARERKKRDASIRIAELELKALEAQINPHFIFNALNVIQLFVLKNDPKASQRYLSRFAKLMRLFLESSRSQEHYLAKEIELIQQYVEIEQMCYPDRFTFEIVLAENLQIDEVIVPAMLLQPFVENAIRHGLLHKKSGQGKLLIMFQHYQDELHCQISDDGIGRKQRKAEINTVAPDHVSRGMQIVKERLQLQSFVEQSSIRITVRDLRPGIEIDPGTLVSIRMPYQEGSSI
ncbi:MAG: histidine kinase, partial [Bacteroidota bacterium]